MKRLIACFALALSRLSSIAFLLGVVVATVSTLGAAVSLGAQQAAATGPPSPKGTLYLPPKPLPKAAPGTLIWAERVAQPKLNPPATIWRILYHSRNRTGQDIAVSGLAIVPLTPVPAGGRRAIYAWAHGTVGQGDQCAPSRQIRDNLPVYGGYEVLQGIALVETDYEGLGTPGEPTYLEGISEGHAVLDSVRAAAQLPGVGPPGAVVIAGHSQGGGAALWAAQLAHTYAPELDVRGVVALAPAAHFETIVQAMSAPPFNRYLGYMILATDGLHAAYGNAFDPSQVLTPAALAYLPKASTECVDATIAHWMNKPITSVMAHDPSTVPSMARIFAAESPGSTNPGMPIFLAQGTQDDQVPVAVSAQLETDYCRLGANVSRHVYPNVDHNGVLDAAQADVLVWLSDRYAGRPATSHCGCPAR
jgi:pimeloyl-ACP methyl ester carboxylesterase